MTGLRVERASLNFFDNKSYLEMEINALKELQSSGFTNKKSLTQINVF